MTTSSEVTYPTIGCAVKPTSGSIERASKVLELTKYLQRYRIISGFMLLTLDFFSSLSDSRLRWIILCLRINSVTHSKPEALEQREPHTEWPDK